MSGPQLRVAYYDRAVTLHVHLGQQSGMEANFVLAVIMRRGF